jgi:hypothetical protein
LIRLEKVLRVVSVVVGQCCLADANLLKYKDHCWCCWLHARGNRRTTRNWSVLLGPHEARQRWGQFDNAQNSRWPVGKSFQKVFGRLKLSKDGKRRTQKRCTLIFRMKLVQMFWSGLRYVDKGRCSICSTTITRQSQGPERLLLQSRSANRYPWALTWIMNLRCAAKDSGDMFSSGEVRAREVRLLHCTTLI